MNFDTDKLIIEVEQRPSLWDTSHSGYANKNVQQDNYWSDVCRIFNEGNNSMENKEKDGCCKYSIIILMYKLHSYSKTIVKFV